MQFNILYRYSLKVLHLLLLLSLGGCFSGEMRPIRGFNELIFNSSRSHSEPSLGQEWLVSLVSSQGKEKIEMIHIRSRTKVPLPGLNRADSQPISVSVSANGERVALVRQREDKTELLIYRRRLGTLQRIELNPRGIPRRVSLDSSGKILAVQVSRGGRWDVEVIRLRG